MLAVLAIALCTLPACAAPRYRERPEGCLSDYANVLSSQTVKDFMEFHDILLDEAEVNILLVTVHFFDGKAPSAYTQELFTAWELEDMDFLIVLAPGEDAYYTMAGKRLAAYLPAETQQHLLSTSLQAGFLRQQYDQAVAGYITSLTRVLEKQLNVSIPLDGLFGAQALPTPSASLAPLREDFWDSWLDEDFWADETPEPSVGNVIVREEKRSGISLGKIFLVFIIFSLIFGGKNKKGHKRKNGCGCMGCGPIGWLLALLGIREIFNDN